MVGPSNGSLAFNRPARLKFVHEEKDFSVVILEQTKDEQIKQFLIVVDPLLHETPLGLDGFYYATKDRYVAYLEEAYLANLPKTKPTVSKMIYFDITLVYALIKTRNGITAPTLRSGEAPCGCLVEVNASTKFG